jgi:plastocyanin
VPSAGAAQTPTANPVISAVSIASFEQKDVLVAADVPLKMEFDNKQSGVPHNVGVYDTAARAKEIFKGKEIIGPGTIAYDVPALAPGSYYFQCDIHPNMNGSLTAK